MPAERVRGLGWVRVSMCLGLTWLASLAACSDDPPSNGGPMDAGADAGDEPDLLPRRDGGVVEGDPVPDCTDRFSPTACPAGKICDVVLRRAPDEEQFTIYTGCVDPGPERLLGEPCIPWGGGLRPVEADGLIDEVYSDPCGPGLYCAPDPKIRDLNTCQPACNTNTSINASLGLAPRGCGSDAEYCTGPGPFEEVCVPGDDCDPRDPDACGSAAGCFLRLNHAGSAALSVCLPRVEMPVADGQPCQYLNECAPGASCWGPAGVPPSRWANADYLCRRSCELSANGDDAGADEDAGASDAGAAAVGACGGGLSCTSLGDGISYAPISAPFGQCE